MFSFKDGMQILPKAIAKHLGNKVNLQCEVTSIEKNQIGYSRLIINKHGEDKIIDCDISYFNSSGLYCSRAF